MQWAEAVATYPEDPYPRSHRKMASVFCASSSVGGNMIHVQMILCHMVMVFVVFKCE